MEPLIKKGSIITAELHPAEPYTVGDIVLFVKNNQVVAHRLIALQGKQALTKGDNQQQYDSWINEHEIIGKILRVAGKDHSFDLQGNNFLAHRFTRFFFVWYSKANHFFPALFTFKKLGNSAFFKKIYRKIISL